MSDAARTQELVLTYEHFVSNWEDAPVSVTTAINVQNAVLSRIPAWLRSGQDYTIRGADDQQSDTIAPGTWFKFLGVIQIRLSRNAIGNGTRPVAIRPYAA